VQKKEIKCLKLIKIINSKKESLKINCIKPVIWEDIVWYINAEKMWLCSQREKNKDLKENNINNILL
jgi:hypothetical protein